MLGFLGREYGRFDFGYRPQNDKVTGLLQTR